MSKPFRTVLRAFNNNNKSHLEPTTPQSEFISTTNTTPNTTATMSAGSPFPEPRVVITSHTSSGKAIIGQDTTLPNFHPFGPSATGFTTIHTVPSIPASLTTPLVPSPEKSIPRPPPAGLVCCTTDFPPHHISPVHRTITCDYMIVLKGELVLKVDDGEETLLKEGDVCVQRGTMHAWENRSDEWTRCLAFMVGGEKIVMADGQALEQSFTPPPRK